MKEIREEQFAQSKNNQNWYWHNLTFERLGYNNVRRPRVKTNPGLGYVLPSII
jgi:hypothetical protein